MRKILKFSASWCMPCKSLQKNIEALPKEFRDKIESYDIDECDPKLVSKFSVRGVPTMILLNENNDILKRVSGSQTTKFVQDLLTED